MVQVQFDLDEYEDKNVRIYMAYNDLSSKTEAIKKIINEYFLIRPPKFVVDEPKIPTLEEVKDE